MNPTITAYETLPAVGLHGLALAGCPPRRWAARTWGAAHLAPIGQPLSREHTRQDISRRER